MTPSCHCSSIDIYLLAKNVKVTLTELPGETHITLYQCNKCGALIAKDMTPEAED